MGFLQVVSSPLTRSSYHAEQVRTLMQQYPRQLLQRKILGKVIAIKLQLD
ncbi:MAG TPA: hypothetical protein IGP91_10930 [Thermosynechococcus sp. M46_R2017_013]|nr:hypothetical protein [Thermosynechococcus sp. M46_R2017_013]